MDTFLIKAAQLILAFAILVIIHEFGHFLFARIFGVKVEKFFIFFDPWKSLFSWKPGEYVTIFGRKRLLRKAREREAAENPPQAVGSKGFWRDTEYGIGWLPLGGYCKIAGMIDESMDTEQMKQEPQEWEFRSKPAWQRLLIMVAGVLFNFLLAILIYAGIVYATGERYVPVNKAQMGFAYSDEAHKIGFQDGDIPLYADDEELTAPGDARMNMIQASRVKVLREGRDTVTIAIPSDFLLRLDEEAKNPETMINFMAYRIPTLITQVAPGEAAERAGVQVGDTVIAINGVATPSLDVFLATLQGHENEKIDLKVVRPGQARTDTLTLPMTLNPDSKMGVGLEVDPAAFFPAFTKKYGLFESVPRGVEMGVDRLTSYVSSMKLIFTKQGAKSIGGFGAIGSIFPESWDWVAFWNVAAFLSVALAFMNILPIPALDGGHVLFLLYEVIFRRKPSEKFLTYAQVTGMVLLITLLIYANAMDIYRFFIK